MSEEIDRFRQLNIPGLDWVKDSSGIYTLPPYTADQTYVWIYGTSLYEWDISALKVALNLQGQGIGTQILNAICAAADSQGITLTLQAQVHKDSHEDNKRLQAWYERFGFVHVDETKVYMVRQPKGSDHE